MLARTTLAPNNPVLTDTAYDLLARAACLLGLQLDNDNHESYRAISTPASANEETFANFIRCLSGAFHSLGATLYQAGKYGTAIRFLRQGCLVGRVALHLHVNHTDTQEPRKAASDKETEGWENLRGHLSRRWELLGVCYSKIGDRQVGPALSFHLCQVTEERPATGRLRCFHRVSRLVCISAYLCRVGSYEWA